MRYIRAIVSLCILLVPVYALSFTKILVDTSKRELAGNILHLGDLAADAKTIATEFANAWPRASAKEQPSMLTEAQRNYANLVDNFITAKTQTIKDMPKKPDTNNQKKIQASSNFLEGLARGDTKQLFQAFDKKELTEIKQKIDAELKKYPTVTIKKLTDYPGTKAIKTAIKGLLTSAKDIIKTRLKYNR